MSIRFLSLFAALALSLIGLRSAHAQGPEADIQAVVTAADDLVTLRKESILDAFVAMVERDAQPREFKTFAKSLDKGTQFTFNDFERAVKLAAEAGGRELRRGGASSSDIAGLRDARNQALRDLKDKEKDLRDYIKSTLQDALDGTLTPPDDGGGGGGGPGDPGPGPGPGGG